ncbi:hypothetical protein FVE85_1973 [Porphyridium purpureum]|uniref:CCHC-type domain-containing protein n=1 Tax=Porphyridium purpureum TaxID=35688 RepID=A0A5J4YXD4_PORPP|nr:hypothetical protein FVE85_1973 [Porphyridium purpureum]|eukprot:POR0168..scf209_3
MILLHCRFHVWDAMADQEPLGLGSAAKASRPTASSVSKDVDDLRQKVTGMEERVEEQLSQLKDSLKSMLEEVLGTAAVSARLAETSPPPQLLDRDPYAQRTSVGQASGSSNEGTRLKDLFERSRFEKTVRDAMKGNEITGPRDLKFMNTLTKWERCVEGFPPRWVREVVVYAFSGAAEHMFNAALLNGTLRVDATADERWNWAGQRFWSQATQDSVRVEYRGRKLKRDETLTSYHTDLRNLAAALQIPDTDLKVDFVEGLPKKYREMARLHANQQEYEGLLHELISNYGEKLEFSTYLKPTYGGARAQVVRAIEEDEYREISNFDEQSFAQGASQPSPADSVNAIAEAVARVLQASNVCFVCKQPGHWARECTDAAAKERQVGARTQFPTKDASGPGSA